MFTFLNFDGQPGLRYGMSIKKDGSMHRHLRTKEREAYFESIGIDPRRVVTPDLVHGAGAIEATAAIGGTMVSDVDALATDERGLFISVTNADCFPVFFYDPARPAVGIAHSGWRGTLKEVAKSAVRLMAGRFGSRPEDIFAGIGPGIRKCHFEVDPGKGLLYAAYPEFASEKGNRCFVDLPGIIARQLMESGLQGRNIEDSGLCTSCQTEEYFSYRRDQPDEAEVMVAYIGLA